ncbi:sugar transferase [Gryllotalpicola koreensis]|uniref:Sugar transferase n=1 Tax=Gryllotalpicola koreensis TaxID=993086 RepID=A0ABP7ZPB2_9MICO
MTTDAQSLLPIARAVSTPTSPRAEARRSPEARLSRRYLSRLRFSDSAVIALAMGITFVLRVADNGAGARSTIAFEAAVCAVVGLCWYLMLGVIGCRDRRQLGVGAAEYKNLLTGSLIVFGALGIADLVIGAHLGRAYAAAFPIGVVGLALTRWGWRNWLVARGKERRYLRRALVVGSRDDVRYVMRQIQESGGPAYNVVGAAVAELGDPYLREGGSQVPVLSGYANVAAAAAAAEVDAVIVASQPHDDGEFVRNLGWSLEGCGADLVLASRLVDVAGPRVRFTPVQGLPLIHVDIPRFEGGKHVLKRFVDVVGAASALILLSPVFAAVAVLIKLDDRGPVFFRQTRVGKDGSLFRMVKFRSMVTDAEARLAALRAESDDGNGMLFKLKDDPRVTRVGRLLRKYSIDEFPQFWNILIGEMSLVGPRPPLPAEVAEYENPVHRRLYIKPGLTGLWQISGRSDLSWDQSVRLDLYYVENWSLAGDLMILWRTVRVLLSPVGAY